MHRIAFFLLWILSLCAAQYDCIFIGSSPLMLFEALYQHALGKQVLILEEHSVCGGSWQSIDICGVMHADLGCHEIGNLLQLKEFLQEYGGCSLRSFESGTQVYFSGGCYELIHNLEQRICYSSIHLLKNHKVDRVRFEEQTAIVESQGERFRCNKVYAPSYTQFAIGDESPKPLQKHKFPHLYILIHDPTPARFAYRANISNAVRMMNLTHFVDLAGTQMQLIVFQTWNTDLSAEQFLSNLKSQNLVDSAAYILKAEWFIYEQYPSTTIQLAGNPCFEQLRTFSFTSIAEHVERWKKALAPYREAGLKH